MEQGIELARNLMSVWFQLSPFESTFFMVSLMGSYLRASLVDCLVRLGPDEDVTGEGRGIPGGVAPYEIA